MSTHDNAFDEGWLEWFSGCYRTTAQSMPPEQRVQLEAAFYAGAAFGGRVARDHGHQVVIDAINAHLERTKAQSYYCQCCDAYFGEAELVDGAACPRCRLVL